MAFVFLRLTSLGMIISGSIHVAANGIISFLVFFFLLAESYSMVGVYVCICGGVYICGTCHILGLPRWHSGKKSACQCRRCKRCGFNPWVGKIPCRRAQQPTLVFLPGESHRQRSLAGYSPMGLQRIGHD